MRIWVPLLVLTLGLACSGGLEGDTADITPTDPLDTGWSEQPPVAAPRPAPKPRKPKKKKPGTRPGPAPPSAPDPAPEPPPPPPAPPAEEPDEGGPKRPPGEKPPGITKISDSRYEVRESLFDRWKDDPYMLANTVVQSGDGWSVKGVRQKDAYHLGLHNSDVVVEVNNKKLKTQAQLMAAWLTLKGKSSFDVEFYRAGKKKTYHYEIVD